MAKRSCSIRGCDRPSRKRGWCEFHYNRWRRSGDPEKLPPRPSLAERFWPLVAKGDGDACWEWTAGVATGGYGCFSIRSKTHGSHRVAYELANGKIPPGMSICHSCDNPPCCNPAHLFIGTALDNNRDRAAKGRGAKTKPNLQRFTAPEVEEIRERVAAGETRQGVATSLGVSPSTITHVVLGYRPYDF